MILENPEWAKIAAWGSMLFGMLGCILYNSVWAAGRHTRHYQWYEYFISLGYAMLFALCFGVVAVVVGVVLYIVGYFLSMIFTATFAAAVYGG